MSEVVSKAQSTAQPQIESLGYILIEVTYAKKYGTPTLTFFIDTDSENGIGLDDCEIVSKSIEPLLDEADVSQGVAYNLEVSSPGLDRPLKTERDFRKNMGKEIEISFFAPINGSKKVQGVLCAHTDTDVTISVKNKQSVFQKKDISIIKPVIKF